MARRRYHRAESIRTVESLDTATSTECGDGGESDEHHRLEKEEVVVVAPITIPSSAEDVTEEPSESQMSTSYPKTPVITNVHRATRACNAADCFNVQKALSLRGWE